MRLDKFSNPIFNESDLFNLLYQKEETSLTDLEQLVLEPSIDLSYLESILGFSFKKYVEPSVQTIDQLDDFNQKKWFIPVEYQSFNIEDYCLGLCQSDQEKDRVFEEMKAFRHYKMIPVLQWLKYFVDKCLENNILWGVGRGSSVSSFVLYLLGVHQINPLKYNLDWHDFLR